MTRIRRAKLCVCFVLGAPLAQSAALAGCAVGDNGQSAILADAATPGSAGEAAAPDEADSASITLDARPTPSGDGGADAGEGKGDADPGADAAAIDATSGPDVAAVDATSGLDAGALGDAGDAGRTGLDAGQDSGSDGTVGASCAGIPAWVEGTTAQIVANLGEEYTCITPAWCSLTGVSAVLAYEPGTGSAWQLAWKDDGPCH